MAWYHVNSCDCPIGCCDCGPERPAKIWTEDELNKKNAFVYYAYNPFFNLEEIIGTDERRKPSYHKTWKFIYLGKLTNKKENTNV